MRMQAALAISVITIGYITYFFTIHSDYLQQYLIKKHGRDKALSSWVIFQRLTGAAIFGILPVALVIVQNDGLGEIGLTFRSHSHILGWMIGLSLVCILVNSFASRKPDHLDMYPQIRTPLPWGKDLLFTSALTLVLYTFAYEIMFRGYLLFTCEREMGAMLAIVINTSIYSLVHIPKGWKETVGAIPMGVILCWLTLKTGNIWIAVVVHSALALSSEWFSIYFHLKKSTI